MSNPRTKFQIRRSADLQTTIAELTGPIANITLRIRSRLSARQRRAIAVTFFRQIRPWLHYFRSESISHSGGDYNFRRHEARGIKLFESSGFEGPLGQLGFQIRMRRLEAGLTQAELAQRAGMNRGHLSEIERGLYQPGPEVLRKLNAALSNTDPTLA